MASVRIRGSDLRFFHPDGKRPHRPVVRGEPEGAGRGGDRARRGPGAPHSRPLRSRGGRGRDGEEDGSPRRGDLRARGGPQGEGGPRGTAAPRGRGDERGRDGQRPGVRGHDDRGAPLVRPWRSGRLRAENPVGPHHLPLRRHWDLRRHALIVELYPIDVAMLRSGPFHHGLPQASKARPPQPKRDSDPTAVPIPSRTRPLFAEPRSLAGNALSSRAG